MSHIRRNRHLPSHITHELFAGAALDGAFDAEHVGRLESVRSYWVLGAQGPDLFLHNHRTHPSGLVYGKMLHTDGYGTFTQHMVETALNRGDGIDSQLGAYILGFSTHAILDRYTHPFVNYFSGWVERGNIETLRFHNCHAFFERILDVLMLKLVADRLVFEYDFHARVDCGEEMPDSLVEAMVLSIQATYPEYRGHASISERVANAYRDTLGFYEFTNPTNHDGLRHAGERDEGGGNPVRRLLALFHPHRLPDLDYLNAGRGEWNHPGDPEELHSESFPDLFEKALQTCVSQLRVVGAALAGTGRVDEVATAVGDENLSDGRTKRARRRLKYCNPLPLPSVLESLYEAIRSGEIT